MKDKRDISLDVAVGQLMFLGKYYGDLPKDEEGNLKHMAFARRKEDVVYDNKNHMYFGKLEQETLEKENSFDFLDKNLDRIVQLAKPEYAVEVLEKAMVDENIKRNLPSIYKKLHYMLQQQKRHLKLKTRKSRCCMPCF